MADRPFVLASCAMSIDGYLSGPGPQRLLLSNAADLDRVDGERARCDAILVGAATVRRDDPRLEPRTPARRQERIAAGLKPAPLKVTLTASGRLDAGAALFGGEAEKLVYCAGDAARLRDRLAAVATVIEAGPTVSLPWLLADLRARGVRRLMVEGGGAVLTQFLAADLVDELQLVVAPFFVGDARARRLVDDGAFPWRPPRRARLLETRAVGDCALLRYALTPTR